MGRIPSCSQPPYRPSPAEAFVPVAFALLLVLALRLAPVADRFIQELACR